MPLTRTYSALTGKFSYCKFVRKNGVKCIKFNLVYFRFLTCYPHFLGEGEGGRGRTGSPSHGCKSNMNTITIQICLWLQDCRKRLRREKVRQLLKVVFMTVNCLYPSPFLKETVKEFVSDFLYTNCTIKQKKSRAQIVREFVKEPRIDSWAP
jgi:hypothetical protein